MPGDEDKVITVDVLKDGSLKIDTGDMSGALHTEAEGAVEALTKAAGGKWEVAKQASKGHYEKHKHEHRH